MHENFLNFVTYARKSFPILSPMVEVFRSVLPRQIFHGALSSVKTSATPFSNETTASYYSPELCSKHLKLQKILPKDFACKARLGLNPLITTIFALVPQRTPSNPFFRLCLKHRYQIILFDYTTHLCEPFRLLPSYEKIYMKCFFEIYAMISPPEWKRSQRVAFFNYILRPIIPESLPVLSKFPCFLLTTAMDYN